MLAFPVPEMVPVNGIRLSVHRAGPAAKTARGVVLLLHGFPDLALTWRYQIPALARAGYMVIAPDMRGYGRSDKPQDRKAYAMDVLSEDMTGLLNYYDVAKAAVVGHDWGALIGWSLPFYCPDRIAAVAGLNVPFLARGPLAPTTLFQHAFGEKMYIIRFQDEGVCEAIFAQDMARTMRFFLRRPKTGDHDAANGVFASDDLDLVGWLEKPEDEWPGQAFLPDNLMQSYIDAFTKGGMTAPLHYYRNLDENWQAMARYQPPGEEVDLTLPALMITAERDGVCPPHLADGMEAYFRDYERADIKGAGHWTQQEKPDEVNRILIDWLGRKLA